MPVTLPPISRRRFLQASVGTGTAVWAARCGLADERNRDADRFALLADTHVSGQRDAVVRDAHLFDSLKQVGSQLVAEEKIPASVMINGDCAYLSGEADDYSVLVELLQPVREAGMPVHLTLGNHDHRERFWKALPPEAGQNAKVPERHLTVIPSARANWFLLDSLDATNKTPGRLGEKQLAWLAQALDDHADRPALVMVHHNPDVIDTITGLLDTKPFLDVLRARKHVKAFFFGHTHNWHLKQEEEGLHLVNLPPVAYVFQKGRPRGWVDVQLNDGGAALTLRCLDADHPQHGETTQLTWRAS